MFEKNGLEDASQEMAEWIQEVIELQERFYDMERKRYRTWCDMVEQTMKLHGRLGQLTGAGVNE